MPASGVFLGILLSVLTTLALASFVAAILSPENASLLFLAALIFSIASVAVVRDALKD